MVPPSTEPNVSGEKSRVAPEVASNASVQNSNFARIMSRNTNVDCVSQLLCGIWRPCGQSHPIPRRLTDKSHAFQMAVDSGVSSTSVDWLSVLLDKVSQ